MQQRSFQYSDPNVGNTSKFAHIFNLRRANQNENLPQPIFTPNQQINNHPFTPQFQAPPQNFQPFPRDIYQQQNFANPNQFPQNPTYYNPMMFQQPPQVAVNRSFKSKTSLWKDFKRIYITEVLTFTMSKATLFTLIFSFMFLGCIFFLSGFFTATSIYRAQHSESNVARKHEPSETAMLQGRPGKSVDMGQGQNYPVPKNYQYQGGVRMNHGGRRPSAYTEQQIVTQQPYYR